MLNLRADSYKKIVRFRTLFIIKLGINTVNLKVAGSNIVSILDGDGVKVMPESIPVPNLVLAYETKKKNKVAKWGTPKKH